MTKYNTFEHHLLNTLARRSSPTNSMPKTITNIQCSRSPQVSEFGNGIAIERSQEQDESMPYTSFTRNMHSCSSSSISSMSTTSTTASESTPPSTISEPISFPPSHQGEEDTEQIEEQTEDYKTCTWHMYNRIVNSRKRASTKKNRSSLPQRTEQDQMNYVSTSDYCSSPNSSRKRSCEFCEFLSKNQTADDEIFQFEM